MPGHNQQALDFSGSVRPRATGSPTPLQPRETAHPKRGRAPTTTSTEPTLPPHRRTHTAWKAPALKPTGSFMFKGVHPLYSRHVLEDEHHKMEIRCTQPDCNHKKKIDRILHGTNNYRTHYHKEHPGIPTSESDATAKLKAQANAAGNAEKSFFAKPVSDQTHDQRYRDLLLQWVIKNNLSFAIVDQPETRALFSFLSPATKQISRTTLMRDLKQRYEAGEAAVQTKLQDHIATGGRIALTTDGWAGNNKLDYIAVTGHIIHKATGKMESLLLDIIELTNPVHDGLYLAQKLLEVTDRLQITCAIMSVTRDNASPNNTMLDEFEAVVASQWEAMNELDQARFCCKFNRKDGDVRCIAHIYNIAVQAGKHFTYMCEGRIGIRNPRASYYFCRAREEFKC
jgi:hypothetical protein